MDRIVRSAGAGVPRRDALAAAGLGVSSFLLPAASGATSLSYTPSPTALEQEWTTVSGTLGLGIATDGTHVYLRNQSSGEQVRRIGFDGTEISQHTIGGASTSNILSTTATAVERGRNDLAHSAGHLFIRSSPGNVATDPGRLFALEITGDATWPLVEVTVPADKPLLVGRAYMTTNLLDLPDGRIGCVSAPTGSGSSWQSTLRLYTVTIGGGSITLAWDRDIALADSEDYPADCHGAASDGTYLHRLEWSASGYRTRTWSLPTSGTATVVSAPAAFTTLGGNVPTWMAHDHAAGRFLIGNYSGTAEFFIGSA